MAYYTRLKQGESVMVGAATLTMAEVGQGRASIRVQSDTTEALIGPLAEDDKAQIAGALVTVLNIKGGRARILFDAAPTIEIRRSASP